MITVQLLTATGITDMGDGVTVNETGCVSSTAI